MTKENDISRAELSTQIQYKLTEELSASTKRYKDLLNRLTEAVFECDNDGTITYLNQAWEKIFDYSLTPSLGSNLTNFVHDGDKNKLFEVISNRENSRLEVRFKRSNGDILWIEVMLHNDETGGKQGFLHDVTQRKKSEQKIIRFNKDLEQRVKERTKELERTNQSLAQSIDELKKTQEQLVEAEKMAALGELVAGVAHEINTPLGISLTASTFSAELLEKISGKIKEPMINTSDLEILTNKSLESSNIIVSNLKRAADLIRSFKKVAVNQTVESLQYFDIKQCIEDVTKSLAPSYKHLEHSIDIICPDNMQVYGNPGAIFQILTSLITNSLIHGFKGIDKGEIAISILPNQNIFLLRYSDNGCGISSDNLDKVFEPFFTTARNHGKTGLGMYITYNIVVHKLSGSISCSSKEGQGVVFDIMLPIDKKPENRCGKPVNAT